MKAIRITRKVKDEFLADYAPSVQTESETYPVDYASAQGFITAQCDSEHYVIVEEIEVKDAL